MIKENISKTERQLVILDLSWWLFIHYSTFAVDLFSCVV